jgi:hypothetical protein
MGEKMRKKMNHKLGLCRVLFASIFFCCLLGCSGSDGPQGIQDEPQGIQHELVILSGDHQGEVIKLDGPDDIIFGSEEGFADFLFDGELDKAHLEFWLEDGDLWVRPLHDNNYYTIVDDNYLISPTVLKAGNLIQLGEYVQPNDPKPLQDDASDAMESQEGQEGNIILLYRQTNGGAKPEPFYAIAHMANTMSLVDHAARWHANALEMDLHFDASGIPTEFKHGWPCDCTCSPLNDTCKAIPKTIKCTANTLANAQLEHIGIVWPFALVIIDSKIKEEDSEVKMINAGRNVVGLLEESLFSKGYKGNVVIGCAKLWGFPYLKAAAEEAGNSRYKSRIFFTIDQGGKEVYRVLNALIKLPTKNRAYGVGISACLAGNYYKEIQVAVANKLAGVVGLVYIWTIDKEESMERYVALNVGGIMSNNPALAYQVFGEHKHKYTYADVNTVIPAATRDNAVVLASKCDCNYHRNHSVTPKIPGGCAIGVPAQSGKACRCGMTVAASCGGDNSPCQDQNSIYCTAPDTSIGSCVEGGGDCMGYQESCDCDIKFWGLLYARIILFGIFMFCQVDCRMCYAPSTNSVSKYFCVA